MAKPRHARQQQAEKERPVRVVTEGCRVIYSDTVNISVSNTGEVALTFYKGAPDPSSITEKTPAYYALAVAQVPLSVAIKLPGIITGQLLQMAELPPSGIEQAIDYLRSLIEQMQTKLDEVKK